jgi:HD-GYP domain-containing protein (c-di-GMP phosphodiesterase class II)
MAHFSAFRAFKNGLNKPCARHDSNVRPLPLKQGSRPRSGFMQSTAPRSRTVGEHLGMHGSELRVLRMGGLLHDIGKIGIPEAILHKPGALTNEEFDVIKQHTTIGANIIGAVPGLAPVIDTRVARALGRRRLSARPDRRADPRRIADRAVCDAFHAMTEDRVYRRAMSTEVALAELQRCSGTQFWPPAVTALDAVIRHGHRAVRYAPELA